MSRRVRVAFIGTGGIAGQHLESIDKFRDAEVVGLCDVKSSKLKERQEKYGGEIFKDPAKMLDSVELID